MTTVADGGMVTLTNDGVGYSNFGSFALVATSPDDPDTGIGDNVADVDLRYVGVRSVVSDDITGFGLCDEPVMLHFAATTWNRQLHANAPALFEFDLDLDQDGTFDYAVYNLDVAGGALSDGRNLTWALNLATNTQTGFWFTQHSTNSANTVLTICLEQIGLTEADIGTEIDVLALAADWYNSGLVTDFAEFSMVIGADRYTAEFANQEFFGGDGWSQWGSFVDAGSTDEMTVTDNGAAGTTDELGILLQLDGSWFWGPAGAPADNDTIVIEVTP
jgi:hypothetical protein